MRFTGVKGGRSDLVQSRFFRPARGSEARKKIAACFSVGDTRQDFVLQSRHESFLLEAVSLRVSAIARM
jgi:hypothetical protein